MHGLEETPAERKEEDTRAEEVMVVLAPKLPRHRYDLALQADIVLPPSAFLFSMKESLHTSAYKTCTSSEV